MKQSLKNTMYTLQGIAVSPGVAIGETLVIDDEGFSIPRRFVARDRLDEEFERLNRAIASVSAEIVNSREVISQELGDQYGAIFSAHLQILHDRQFSNEVETLIRNRHYSPEYAVSLTFRRYAKVFQSINSSYLAERADDIFDIEKRLLSNLLGHRREDLSQINMPVVVLAHKLTPSETACLDRKNVLGFVTETGGQGGHTAIVAEALEIPAVVGLGHFLSEVSGGDLIIVDGDQGQVIFQPDEDTIVRYRQEVEDHRSQVVRLESLRDLPAETTDGHLIHLNANIEFPHEVDACLNRGADGIGLYRTEFLYLGAKTEPTEEIHFEAYANVVQSMTGRPVIMRSLDLGADKMGMLPTSDEEKNPFLGLRSIRLSFRNLPMFRTQLRAILRASALGDLRVMFPLISTIAEFRQAKMILLDLMEDLEEERIPFNRDIPVGIMVEVPSIVLMLDRLIDEVDFISIGTNDLTQYTLAVDRSNKDVASLYNAADPSVLRLIRMAVKIADDAQVSAGLCGQMSGSTIHTMLLLGLGLRDLSVPPSAIPEIKKICRSVSISQCETIANRALLMDNSREISIFLRKELRQIAPETVIH